MTSCVVCKSSKGKFSCGCLCADATVHRMCMVSLAVSAYRRKSKNCVKCGGELSCLKPHHYSQAVRRVMEDRLGLSGVHFGKTGMTPMCRTREGSGVSEDVKKRVQEQWETVVEKEIADAPDFAQKTLKSVKKRKVEFRYSGSKWD